MFEQWASFEKVWDKISSSPAWGRDLFGSEIDETKVITKEEVTEREQEVEFE